MKVETIDESGMQLLIKSMGVETCFGAFSDAEALAEAVKRGLGLQSYSDDDLTGELSRRGTGVGRVAAAAAAISEPRDDSARMWMLAASAVLLVLSYLLIRRGYRAL